MYGAAPTTPGTRRASAARLKRFRLQSGGGLIRACADSDSRRSRSSPSKPFITERMTISAATPTHTPATDTHVMKETKNLWLRART